MIKAIIAAGASAVLAAMPVVGVFAVTNHINGSPIVDTLTVNLSEVCTLSRKVADADAGHPAGTSSATNTGWTEGTATADAVIAGVTMVGGEDQDTFAATIIAGNTYDAIAKSAFNVTCNDVNGGYKVTVATSGFTGVENAATWNYNAGGYANSGSSWTLDSSNADKNLAQNIVWQKAQTNAITFNSDDFTITYGVKADIAQEQGSYTANAVYTLADLGA